ncbi:MAG: PAS domain S-box protein [Acidobacteriota bacterium]
MENLELTFKVGPLVIFKWKNAENWPVEYVSDNVFQNIGYSKKEILDTGFIYSDIIHKDDLQRVGGEVADNSKAGVEYFAHNPYRIIKKNKEVIWVDDYTHILRNKAGEITHYIGYIINVTNRIKAEEQNKKLLTAVEQSANSVIITDTEGMVEYINPKFSKLTGYKIDEVIGKTPRILNSDIHSDSFYKEMWDTISSGKIWKGELCNKKKSGELYWEQSTITPVKDENNKIVNYIAIKEDITDRKKAEIALKESEETFKRFFEDNQAVMLQVDVNSKMIVGCNSAAINYYGYSKKKLLSLPIYKITNLSLEDTKKKMKIAVQRESNYFYFEHELANGEKRDVEVYASPIKIQNETRMFLIVHDITDRKKIEKELQINEEKYRTLIEDSNDAIYLLYENKFEIINKKFIELFEVTEEEVRNEDFDFMTLVSPKSVEMIKERNRSLERAEQLGKNYEFTALNKSGKEINVEVSVSYIKYKKGTAVQGILRDVTKRKQLEQRIAHSQKMESLGEFAGGIAHDFNNILSSIFGLTELSLLNVKKNLPVTDNLEQILNASMRGKELIHNIMTFTRETEDLDVEINFAEVIKDVMKLIKPIVPSTIRIKLDIRAEDKMIVANTVNIYTVLMNLCANAIHAMEGKRGMLKITLEEFAVEKDDHSLNLKDGKYVKLTVSDNGKGISKELQKRIFEPFFTTKPRGVGAGMGLSTVHAIISGYNGDITVYSEEGEGTSISVFLPVAGFVSKYKQQKKKEEPLLRGNERILFVDDEINITAIYEEMLTVMGYSVTTRNCSTRALELFLADPSKFDIIITDHTMPNMTGIKLAEEIKSIRKDIPVILCSGLSESLNFENLEKHIIDKILQKPVQISEFLKSIRDVLESSQYN